MDILSKVLIKYGKNGPLKFLSHLELIRALERSFRRAGIDVCMSGGFSPRPKISHGLAIGVGVASGAEYLVAELCDPIPEDEVLEKLTVVLPKGLSVYAAKYIKDKQSSIASTVQAVAYRVTAELCSADLDVDSLIERLLGRASLSIRHKGTEKWVETRRAILDLKAEQRDGSTQVFYMLLSAGDQNAVRPEAVIEKLVEVVPDGCPSTVTDIYRLEQYVNRENPLIDIYNFYESVKMGSERTKS